MGRTSAPYAAIVPSPLPDVALGIRVCGLEVSGIEFLSADDVTRHGECSCPNEAAVRTVVSQLNAYFRGSEQQFSFPMAFRGTAFQRRVWGQLSLIPAGETRSYADLASQLKSSPRAVGNACRENPFPIVVPCHRVVGVRGLGGYCGAREGQRLHIKRWLLDHESRGTIQP